MSLVSLIKEKPQKKSERLFQFFGILSILILAGSILGVTSMMFYRWYTPWHTDYLISWPEFLGMAGVMWWQFINSVYIYIASIFLNISSEDFEFFLPSSIVTNLIFLTILFFSIKSILTKKYQKLTTLTKKTIKTFIFLFMLNLIITVIGIVDFFYIHFLK